VVECTGLENQQSRKVLVGSNPTASAIPPRRVRRVTIFRTGTQFCARRESRWLSGLITFDNDAIPSA
jgi:hypothetical protein